MGVSKNGGTAKSSKMFLFGSRVLRITNMDDICVNYEISEIISAPTWQASVSSSTPLYVDLAKWMAILALERSWLLAKDRWYYYNYTLYIHVWYIYIYIYILYNMILFYLFSQHKIYGRFETLVWENWRITPLYYILAVICVELALRFFLGDPSTSEILVNNNQDVAPSLAISVMSQIHNIFNVEPWYYPVGKSS